MKTMVETKIDYDMLYGKIIDKSELLRFMNFKVPEDYDCERDNLVKYVHRQQSDFEIEFKYEKISDSISKSLEEIFFNSDKSFDHPLLGSQEDIIGDIISEGQEVSEFEGGGYVFDLGFSESAASHYPMSRFGQHNFGRYNYMRQKACRSIQLPTHSNLNLLLRIFHKEHSIDLDFHISSFSSMFGWNIDYSKCKYIL